MKELILYYTIGGTCRFYAEKRAKESGADVLEIKEPKKRSKLGAFCPGVFQALGQKSSNILPLEKNLDEYDKIILVTPIWAGHQAPAMNSVAALIPKGKKVEIVTLSGAGNFNYGDNLAAIVKDFGGEIVEKTNIKAGSLK